MKRTAALLLVATAATLALCSLAAAGQRTAHVAAPTPAQLAAQLVPTLKVVSGGQTLVTLKTSELTVLPQVVDTVSIGGQSLVEAGPTLSSLLTYAGVTYNSACKNDELRWWIQATSSNGSAVALTSGEIDPGFGNRPAILSISQDGSYLTTSGPRLIVPNDKTSARDLSHVSVITVGRAPAQLADVTPACAATGLVSPTPAAGSVLINGDVASPMTLTWAQLAAMTQINQSVSFLSGSNATVDSETGATLYDAVMAAKPKFLACDPTDKLRFYVEITSSEDGYSSLMSWAEFDPSLDNDLSLLSLSENGVSQSTVGPRLTAPGDVKGGRYVSGTAIVTVFRAPTEVRIPSCANTTKK